MGSQVQGLGFRVRFRVLIRIFLFFITISVLRYIDPEPESKVRSLGP